MCLIQVSFSVNLASVGEVKRQIMLRFLIWNLKGYRLLTVTAIIMAIVQVGFDLLGAFPFKFIIDKLQKNTNPPSFLDSIISFFDSFNASQHLTKGEHTFLGVVIFSVLLQIVFGSFSAILNYFQVLSTTFVARNMTARLREQLFEHLEHLTLNWHNEQKKGDLVQRITNDIAYIERLVTDGIVFLFVSALTLIGIIIIMLALNWQFTLLALVIIPPLAIIVFFYTTTIKVAARKEMQTASAVANVVTEDIEAIAVLKSFTLEEHEVVRFGHYIQMNRQAGLRTSSLQAQYIPIVSTLVSVWTAIIIGVGAFVAGGHNFNILFLTVPRDSLSIGDLTVFLVYLKLLYQPMRDLARLTNIFTNASVAVERTQEVLDQAPEVFENTESYFGPAKLKGDISFEKVVFGYSKHHPILKGINLHVPAGKIVAIVGLSGCGKTTLVNLIPRFYEIQRGIIKIDGIDNRVYPLEVLRKNVSLVLQENMLFEGTIRENIELGKPDASMEEIVDAAKKAHIHEMIIDMPNGYDTQISEQGKNFSGGQRQRFTIARALLRDAPILILDEPSAALDVEAEAEIMRSLDELVIGRTVLMISHRLSTLGKVDEIIVLKDGHIVEQGTFTELKYLGGVFSGLLEKQNRYNPDSVDHKSVTRLGFISFLLQKARWLSKLRPIRMKQKR